MKFCFSCMRTVIQRAPEARQRTLSRCAPIPPEGATVTHGRALCSSASLSNRRLDPVSAKGAAAYAITLRAYPAGRGRLFTHGGAPLQFCFSFQEKIGSCERQRRGSVRHHAARPFRRKGTTGTYGGVL